MTLRWRAFAAVATFALASACGGGDDDTPVPADAAAPPADAGVSIELPAPPTLTPCPEGWREVVTPGEPTTCDPWPETGRETCTAPDEEHFPGEPGCSRVGTPCPAGAFADDLPTDVPILYVSASAPAGGSGTMASPLRSVTTAVNRSVRGAIVALAKGVYDEAVVMRPGVTLWGACVAETVVRESTPTFVGVIEVLDPDVTIRNLRIGTSPTQGILVGGAGASATIRDVVVEQARTCGLTAIDGASVTADRLVIRNMQQNPMTLRGRGIQVGTGATAEIRHFVLRRLYDVGVVVGGGGPVLFADGAVLDCLAGAEDISGRGITSDVDASLEIARVVVERASSWGLEVEGSLVFRDLVVRDTLPDRGGTEGGGILIHGTTRAERVLVERVRVAGIANMESEATVSDLVVRDVDPEELTGYAGYGAYGALGGSLTIERADIRRAGSSAILAFGDATAVSATDVTVADVRGDSRGYFGRGAEASSGGSMAITRGRFERARDTALFANGPGSALSGADVTITDTLPRACATTTCPEQPLGIGVGSYGQAAITLARFDVHAAALCGVHVAFDGAIDLASGRVADSPIGACVQTPGYDVARLSRDVLYEGNGRSLDTPSLPLPPSLDPLPPP